MPQCKVTPSALAPPTKQATAPAVWGEAMEVPESTVLPPPTFAEVMSCPGAKMSTHAPVLEKNARWSERLVAPVPMAWTTRAGEDPQAFSFSFPAATA